VCRINLTTEYGTRKEDDERCDDSDDDTLIRSAGRRLYGEHELSEEIVKDGRRSKRQSQIGNHDQPLALVSIINHFGQRSRQCQVDDTVVDENRWNRIAKNDRSLDQSLRRQLACFSALPESSVRSSSECKKPATARWRRRPKGVSHFQKTALLSTGVFPMRGFSLATARFRAGIFDRKTQIIRKLA